MVTGCAPKVVKMTFFTVNFIVWLASLCIVGVSSWLLYYANQYEDLFAAKTMYSIIISLLCAGVGLFLIGFCGCCGAMKEGSCMLKVYFILMIVIIVGELTGGIVSVIFSTKIEDSMTDGMTKTIHETYGVNTAATNAVDDIQESFECCGATNYTDYKHAQHIAKNVAVPSSCCKSGGENCTAGTRGEPNHPDLVYSQGCVVKTFDFLRRHLFLLSGLCFVVLAIQCVLVVFTCCLLRAIRRDEEYMSV